MMARVTVRTPLSIDSSTLLNYFDDGNLTCRYLPRHLCEFLILVLRQLISHEDDELRDEFRAQRISRETLAGLITSLSEQPFLSPKKRKLLGYLLRQVRDRQRQLRITNIKPESDSMSQSVPEELINTPVSWPTDIMDIEDLLHSLGEKNLRSDVRTYIFSLMFRSLGTETAFSITTAIQQSKPVKSLPIITIVVESIHAASIRSYIQSASEELNAGDQCEGLLPSDLIAVVCNDRIAAECNVREDHLLVTSNGSPWKEGTLGGLISCSGSTYGITAGHIDQPADVSFDEGVEAVAKVVNASVDVSFFRFIGRGADEATNALPLLMTGVTLQDGEAIYKLGRSTGLQTGVLVGDEPQSFYCPASRQKFVSHFKVRWNADHGSRFGFQGDCGSLYCVKRGAMYVPIAIHRLSTEPDEESGVVLSYGCSFSSAMEYFSPGDDCEFRFQNPPYCTTY